jgi:hypothetical protein
MPLTHYDPLLGVGWETVSLKFERNNVLKLSKQYVYEIQCYDLKNLQ